MGGLQLGMPGIKEADLFLSVLVTGEIRKGIELIRSA